MADNSKLDALMMLMALEAMKSGMTDKTVTPFSVSRERKKNERDLHLSQ